MRNIARSFNCFSNLLKGVGALTLGMAAVITASKGNEIINKLLEIEKKAEQIELGVQGIERATARVHEAIKKIDASEAVKNNAELQNKDASKKDLENALKRSFIFDKGVDNKSVNTGGTRGVEQSVTPSVMGINFSGVYFPANRLTKTAGQLYKKTPAERTNIIEQALQYKTPAFKAPKSRQ